MGRWNAAGYGHTACDVADSNPLPAASPRVETYLKLSAKSFGQLILRSGEILQMAEDVVVAWEHLTVPYTITLHTMQRIAIRYL
jgi:hypothetical protein